MERERRGRRGGEERERRGRGEVHVEGEGWRGRREVEQRRGGLHYLDKLGLISTQSILLLGTFRACINEELSIFCLL